MTNIFPTFWQKEVWRHVLELSDNGNLPSAMLIHGMRGFGLSDFMTHLANAMFCLNRDEGSKRPCGECEACRYYQTKNHPDFFLARPEKIGAQIKIQDVREIINYLLTAGYYGNKLVVILNAERLNNAAANAMLKTLEEPSGNATIMLACYLPSLLPPTIRSRCRAMHFDLPTFDESVQWLREISGRSEVDCRDHLQNADAQPMDALAALQGQDAQANERAQFLNAVDEYLAGRLSAIKLSGDWEKTPPTLVHTWLLGKVNREIKDRLARNSEASLELLFKLYDRQVSRCRPSAERMAPMLLLHSALYEMRFAFAAGK